MKEQERYFFEPRSLTWCKKQTRQDIRIRLFLFITSDCTQLNIASHVLLQNNRYIFKAFIFSSFNKYGIVIVIY